jgi:DNA-binding SARP family transcriptional activator
LTAGRKEAGANAVEYRLLGSLTVLRDDQALVLGGLRQRAVLAVLLVAGGHVVEADRLVEKVWGDEPPPKPIPSLRSYVTNLRRILGGNGVLERLGTGYRLDTSGSVVDAREFARGVDEGRRRLDMGDATGARSTLADALALWRGTPLADFRDLDFAIPEIHRLEALRADAVELRFDAALELGESTGLVAGLESEVFANPLREKLWWQLMLAMYRCGRRNDALAAFERASAVLESELGVTPGVALQRLASDIRNQVATLDWKQPVAREPARPIDIRRGLFGRPSEARRLRDALDAAVARRTGVIVLSGDSGMGKTALAQYAVDLAEDAGMATVWAGHAAQFRRPPSWAWAHAIRGLAGQLPSGTGNLHAPLPNWWSVATEDADVDGTGPSRGFDVVNATVEALAELTARRPALVVLDDLERADKFTVEVLEHLASSGRRIPLLVVATWQDGGSDSPGASARSSG